MYNFDSIAKSYKKSTKTIPEEFARLIYETFQITKNDNVIDLGCGSGEIALILARTGANVTGIDLSKNMINMAKAHDSEKKVFWEIGDVNEYEFKNNYYKLIISFESFHLFNNAKHLINRITRSLVNNGYFCIGYCIYNWEDTLYKDILDVLSYNRIFLQNWFIQKPDYINNIISTNPLLMLSFPNKRYTSIVETWTVKEIVDFITSTSIFLNKDIDIEKIKQELFDLINKRYGINFVGETKYCISYSQKLVKI